MQREQQFKDRLRESGERVTNPRIGIFRILMRQAPLPMNLLIARAQKDGIDPVTTYRTVDLFRKLHLIQEVGMGRNRLLELSGEYNSHHHHFICTACGKITDFDRRVVEEDLQRLGAELGFRIDSHQLEVTGLCMACQLGDGRGDVL